MSLTIASIEPRGHIVALTISGRTCADLFQTALSNEDSLDFHWVRCNGEHADHLDLEIKSFNVPALLRSLRQPDVWARIEAAAELTR